MKTKFKTNGFDRFLGIMIWSTVILAMLKMGLADDIPWLVVFGPILLPLLVMGLVWLACWVGMKIIAIIKWGLE